VTRVFSVTVGASMAASMIFMMQVPLLHQASTFTSEMARLNVSGASPIAWPDGGSAAVVIPALGVRRSHHNAVVPIASLTKMMTAYVTLEKLPLAPGESGPCITMNPADVTYYETLKDQGQSVAAVAAGERLCENQLLAGLLVHSAGNYATLLANLAWGGTKVFLSHMNADAHALALTGTHYADVTGADPASVSTALDQGELAARLMQNPVVRSIVVQPSVTLPVAGTLGSYTPYAGVDNVVGVKSGRTDAAGGCDVMAMTFTLHGTTQLAFAVVLGARGGDLLGPAGDEALALEHSVIDSHRSVSWPAGTVVGTIGWDNQRVDVVTQQRVSLDWFAAVRANVTAVRIFPQTGPVVAGDVVGWLDVNDGATVRVPLTVAHRIAPLSLVQRLR
jgi:serine-type D-Ala-D-Ala carboxypeptidase (penicillin-binding protein 5/6)